MTLKYFSCYKVTLIDQSSLFFFFQLTQLETLSDIALSISASPSKNYFLMVIAIALALIFLGGLVFGRISKRVKREIKDRWFYLNQKDS